MSEPKRVVQDIYAGFQRGDIGAVLDMLSEDVDFWQGDTPDLPYSGRYRGRQGAADFFEKLGSAVAVSGFSPERYVSEGDEVVAIGVWSGTVRATGKPFSGRWAMWWRVENGKAVAYKGYEETGVILPAFRA